MSDHYVRSVPKDVPEGRVLVHNHIRPQSPLGRNGFRAWIHDPKNLDYKVEVCPCPWAAHLPEHYRVIRERYEK